jgi:hypothetical protein
MLRTMRMRYKAPLILLVVTLVTLTWRGLRDHGAPAEKLGEAVGAVASATLGPAANLAAPAGSDERACIPEISPLRAPRSREEAEAMQSAEQRADEEREKELASTRARLLESRNPEHLAAAALMSEPPARIPPVMQALRAGGDTPLFLWLAAQVCDKASKQDACPADELAERLVAIDPLNSEAWMHAAVRRFKRDDEAGALAAVQRAAASPESRIYWAETIAMIERAHAAAGNLPFTERASAAFGIAAANLPGYSGYTKMCTTRSQASQAWAQACLGYGELAERRGDTDMGASIARSMQVASLKHLNDPARLEALLARQDQARAERDAGTNADMELMMSTPERFAAYLNALAQQGELGARRWSRAEAARLRAELPPCAAR